MKEDNTINLHAICQSINSSSQSGTKTDQSRMQIAHGHIKAILAKVVVRQGSDCTQVMDQVQDSGIPLFDEADANHGLGFGQSLEHYIAKMIAAKIEQIANVNISMSELSFS